MSVHGPSGGGVDVPRIEDQHTADLMRRYVETAEPLLQQLEAYDPALARDTRRLTTAARWRLREWDLRVDKNPPSLT